MFWWLLSGSGVSTKEGAEGRCAFHSGMGGIWWMREDSWKHGACALQMKGTAWAPWVLSQWDGSLQDVGRVCPVSLAAHHSMLGCDLALLDASGVSFRHSPAVGTWRPQQAEDQADGPMPQPLPLLPLERVTAGGEGETWRVDLLWGGQGKALWRLFALLWSMPAPGDIPQVPAVPLGSAVRIHLGSRFQSRSQSSSLRVSSPAGTVLLHTLGCVSMR